ncbi:MAG: hypothetical protein R3B72_41160 [Polyangiaceae bacterium]
MARSRTLGALGALLLVEERGQLANAGMDLIRGGETERGIAELEEALALVPVPAIAVAAAEARIGVGRYVDALATYRNAASMTTPEWIEEMPPMRQQLAHGYARARWHHLPWALGTIASC